LLKPDATGEQIDQLCAEAREYGFASVCVNPYYVARCVKNLKGTDVKVCTVVGFPLGATTAESKAFEALQAIASGAKEIDMVMNIGQFLSRKYSFVHRDIAAVTTAAHARRALCKVILETALLTPVQIRKASEIAIEAGADFIKTSTGFAGGGATPEAVKIMLDAAKDTGVEVKASGGIGDFETAKMYAEMGVARLGVSGAAKILGIGK
jgi:deoxyribose-phosphate aldolase